MIVIDTNVLVAALKSKRGASHKCLTLLPEGKYTVAISIPLILEYEEVLKRFFPQLGEKAIEQFVDYFCYIGQPTQIFYLWRPYLNDPDDEMILELAVASHAQFIVTYNQKDFKKASDFNIQAITPKELLQRLGEIP